MPPPYRRYPIDDARDALLEEQPAYPRVFDVGIPFGQNSFSPAAESGLLGSAQRYSDELFTRNDRMNTEAANNAYTRLSRASESRRLPFTEAAAIASARLADAQDSARIPDVPTFETNAREKALTGIDEERMARRQMPSEEEYQAARRSAALEDLTTRDPYAASLQRTHGATAADLGAYSQFADTAPEALSPRKRQQWAHDQTVGMIKDKEAVSAADFLANDSDNETGKPLDEKATDIIENVTDSAGRLIGQRIKAGADPNRVAQVIASGRRALKKKADQAEIRRQYDSRANDFNRMDDNYAAKLRGLRDELKQIPEASIAKHIHDEIEETKEKSRKLTEEWDAFRKRHNPYSGRDAAPPPAAPAAPEGTPKAPTGSGKESTWKQALQESQK